MKEDILEQIASDYLNLDGYFTLTNVKYRPEKSDADWNGKQDGVYSDIDVIGFNPCKSSPHKVITVSCKSWQGGFCAQWEIDAISSNKLKSGKERWRSYRELASPKWGRAFRKKVHDLTEQPEFEHWIVCTKFCDPENEELWTKNSSFQDNLTRYLRIISLDKIFKDTIEKTSTTPANSELGRLIQLLKVANPEWVVNDISNKR